MCQLPKPILLNYKHNYMLKTQISIVNRTFFKTQHTIICFRHKFQLLTALFQNTKHHPLYFAHFINAKTSLCSDRTHCYSIGKTSISKAVVQFEIKALAIWWPQVSSWFGEQLMATLK